MSSRATDLVRRHSAHHFLSGYFTLPHSFYHFLLLDHYHWSLSQRLKAIWEEHVSAVDKYFHILTHTPKETKGYLNIIQGKMSVVLNATFNTLYIYMFI